ncbi:hypothetical protein [Adlercreutzia sp. CNCM I-6216]
MSGESDKLSAKDWRVLLIGAAVSAFLSAPSWLPVFGIECGWFGNRLVALFQGLLPILMLIAGFLLGWNAHKRRMARDSVAAEREQITRDLSCGDLFALDLIADLYCSGFKMAKGDAAAVGDPTVRAGVVYTAPVEIGGLSSYRMDLEPEKRALFARHEAFFFDEVRRLGHGRLLVDAEKRAVRLASAPPGETG